MMAIDTISDTLATIVARLTPARVGLPCSCARASRAGAERGSGRRVSSGREHTRQQQERAEQQQRDRRIARQRQPAQRRQRGERRPECEQRDPRDRAAQRRNRIDVARRLERGGGHGAHGFPRGQGGTEQRRDDTQESESQRRPADRT